MSKIWINECVYYIHPVHGFYASDENGNVIHIIKKVLHKVNKTSGGYLYFHVRKYGERKMCFVNRFVWECFNSAIPKEKLIDHINNNKEDNRLCNLQLMTQQQNCLKAAKNRDYTFVAKNHKNRKCVKAFNKNTKEVSYFHSMYAVQQHLQINAGIVKMVCEGINDVKAGKSKKDGYYYTFQYIKQDDLPSDHKKSANTIPKRVSDEDKKKHKSEAMKKWQSKEFKCSDCDKVYKNGYRYAHKRHCQKRQKQ